MEELPMAKTQKDQPILSVVIPVFREGSHLRVVLAAVRESLDKCDVPYELVLVDDGSSDDTWRVITEEAKVSPAIRALRLSRNFGKESALCAGLEHTRSKAVIVMDADGQHPPSLLPEMVRIWTSGEADIVEAIKRYRGRESVLGKMSARLFYLIWTRLSGFDLKGASDFKLMDRRVVNEWLRMGERNLFFRGMTAWLGFRTAQIPFEVADRAGGKTGWVLLDRLKLAFTAISAFSSLPLHLVTFAGAVFLVFAAVLGVQTLVVYARGKAVSGFATVILLLLIIGSFLMVSLGIIGIYLARIYEEVKARPRYVVIESIGPDDRQ
jgi:polyisoprenyl-phosphate glycosyltransferase